MTGVLRTGTLRVRVPATSANLGPGYDSFGLALAKHDILEVDVDDSAGPLHIDVDGEGADDVPRDASHLVVRSMLTGLDTWGAQWPGSIRLRCTNTIPHSRGLGSSAAAIVAGLVTARIMLDDPQQVTDSDVLDLASRIEGHPDNVAACLLGGFAVSWTEANRGHAVRLTPDPRILPVACVPTWSMSTEQARSLLPDQVSHADATDTAARAGLLVAAMLARPDLLLEATEDRLHQPYRAGAMTASADLMARLRAASIPAVLSGAGPTVLALTTTHEHSSTAGSDIEAIAGGEWRVEAVAVDAEGATAEYLDPETRLPL